MNALDLGYGVAAAITAPLWMRKTRSGWAQRFARILPELPPREPGVQRVMLHAVSVGEVNALRELVPLLREHAQVVVSVSTDTGIARAQTLFGELAEPKDAQHACCVVRFPLDGSWMVSRFLEAVEPDAVGLVELEIWPNFVRACQKRAIPVAVINGRLSERSFKGYRRIRRWISPSFAALSVAAVQDEAYAQRFVAMGVQPQRCVLTGSMKFDAVKIADDVPGAEQLAHELELDLARPLIVAGSTGPGEEAMLYQIWKDHLRAQGVQLLCAPRKPERFDEAAAALPGCVRRSRQGVSENDRAERTNQGVFLLDTIGELGMAYSLADVAVVGRSFFDLHGSDPIEPIALGAAAIIGPAVSDFATIVEQLEQAGGLVRANQENLGHMLGNLLDDPSRCVEMVSRGRTCIAGLQGASSRHAELLLWLGRDCA